MNNPLMKLMKGPKGAMDGGDSEDSDQDSLSECGQDLLDAITAGDPMKPPVKTLAVRGRRVRRRL